MAKKKIRSEKTRLLARLRRIEGQVSAVVRVAEKDAYCVEMLTQIAAARAALLAAARIILTEHMNSCVVNSFKEGQSKAAIAELEKVLSQFVK